MDELEEIRKRLKAGASDSSEEEICLNLFSKACEGLASHTAGGVREEVEESLGALVEETDEKAGAIRALIRE